MAIHRNPKNKHKPRSPILLLLLSITAIAFLCLFYSSIFTDRFSSLSTKALGTVVNVTNKKQHGLEKYLYWGKRIDCPGKHCDSCEGLGHQESSLRCALEEAMFLQRYCSCVLLSVNQNYNGPKILRYWTDIRDIARTRQYFRETKPVTAIGHTKISRTFVMPSRMCINPIHNKKGILHQSNNASSEERWATSSCAMDSLYDLNLISDTVPVILDNSKIWYQVLSTSMKLGDRGVAHVEGVNRLDLKEKSLYSNLLLINRTASPLSWFMECKDRNNHSAVMLLHSFLPSMAARKLRDAAEQIKGLLGDYDAIHVRRGDKIKTRKDRFGVARSLHPHLDRDTRPEFILNRILKWVAPGRTLFIASNERTPGFFSPLFTRYKLAYSSNYSSILDPVIENNYQLFMVERLIMMGAKTFIRTFKEDDTDLSLTDDPKKNTKVWQIPVYTTDEEGS